MAEFVLPGDKITLHNQVSSDKVHKICGRGINVVRNESYAAVPGFIHENREKFWVNSHYRRPDVRLGDLLYGTVNVINKHLEPQKFWVNSHYRRYFPQSGDKVIGIVTQKYGDIWRVDIGGIEKAEIDFMSFENATKKNRPDVRLGDLLYGTVNVINKHLEPQMTCIDTAGRANGMGILPRYGTVFTVSCSYCRRLLTDSCRIMEILGKSHIFESTVGVNGRIWINADFETVRFLKTVLLKLETVPESEIEAVINKMVAERMQGGTIPMDNNQMEIEEMKVEIKDEMEDGLIA
uniref:Ribosomal RNA-processing protein 40 n=1 Tax=Panagrolaimus sp. JU765 TaxID=591449 RepID=A0AC34QMJ6_9BILA